MRTTVTIDPDTRALLEEEVARTGLSFKQVLNRAVRTALGPRTRKHEVQPLFTQPFPPDLGSFNRLGDEWELEDRLQEMTR